MNCGSPTMVATTWATTRHPTRPTTRRRRGSTSAIRTVTPERSWIRNSVASVPAPNSPSRRRISVRTSRHCAYTPGGSFLPTYRNQIFTAEDGSRKRSRKIGYRVTLVRLEGDGAEAYEPFATGRLQGEKAWGVRPTRRSTATARCSCRTTMPGPSTALPIADRDLRWELTSRRDESRPTKKSRRPTLPSTWRPAFEALSAFYIAPTLHPERRATGAYQCR